MKKKIKDGYAQITVEKKTRYYKHKCAICGGWFSHRSEGVDICQGCFQYIVSTKFENPDKVDEINERIEKLRKKNKKYKQETKEVYHRKKEYNRERYKQQAESKGLEKKKEALKELEALGIEI